MSNGYHVEYVLLKCIPFRSVLAKKCECLDLCRCIVFFTTVEVTNVLALRMPKTLNCLPNSECLLPCLNGMAKRYYGYNQEVDLLLGEEPEERLPDDMIHLEFHVATVCETLNHILWRSMYDQICICIPMYRFDD